MPLSPLSLQRGLFERLRLLRAKWIDRTSLPSGSALDEPQDQNRLLLALNLSCPENSGSGRLRQSVVWLTILPLSRERRESHVRFRCHRGAPLVSLQRSVMPHRTLLPFLFW